MLAEIRVHKDREGVQKGSLDEGGIEALYYMLPRIMGKRMQVIT
jgi:hypothetical protein